MLNVSAPQHTEQHKHGRTLVSENEIMYVNLIVWWCLQLGGSNSGATHESVGLLQYSRQSTPAFGNIQEYDTDDELIL